MIRFRSEAEAAFVAACERSAELMEELDADRPLGEIYAERPELVEEWLSAVQAECLAWRRVLDDPTVDHERVLLEGRGKLAAGE